MNKIVYFFLVSMVAPVHCKWMMKYCPFDHSGNCWNWVCPAHYKNNKYTKQCQYREIVEDRDN